MKKSEVIEYKFKLVWRNMVYRCTNPVYISWNRYGGRGITTCKRWLDFNNFKKDMFCEYKKYMEMVNPFVKNIDFTLDRINNDGNYCKKNCRWTNLKQQCKNRSARTSNCIVKDTTKLVSD